MAIRCEDVTARLLELLYGELPEGERATLQAHVDGCARCKAELAGFQQTRAVARQVLDEPVPARARAAILQAAAAHAPAAKPARPRATEAPPSFWDRLRARWALPTLATVGAIAVFLLASKLLLEPDKAYQRGKEAMEPTPAAAPAVPMPAAEQAAEQGEAKPVDDPLAKRRDESKRKVGQTQELAGPPADAEKDTGDRVLRHATIDQSLGGRKAAKKAAKAPVAAANEKREEPSGGGGLGRLGAGKGAGVGSVGSSVGASGGGSLDGLMNDASPSEQRRFAAPPPARAPAAQPKAKSDMAAEPAYAPPPPPPAAAPRPAPGKREVSESAPEGLDSPTPTSRRGGEAAVKEMAQEEEAEASAERQPRAKKRSAPADDKAPEKKPAAPVVVSAPAASTASAPAGAAAKPAASNASALAGAAGKPAADPLVQRADQLFAQGQWAAAATLYRQLINRDPRNPDAARWRQRLVVAERQNEAVEAAKAVKAAPASASPPR